MEPKQEQFKEEEESLGRWDGVSGQGMGVLDSGGLRVVLK